MSKRQLNIEQVLRDIYYSPTEGFRSTENIYQQAKEEIPDLKRNTVIQFLKRQKTYTMFKSHKGVKQFLPTWVRDFDELQVDLIDLKNAKYISLKDNDNYAYMIIGVEILSRYAFGLPLKRKDGPSTSEGLEKILEQFHSHFEKYPKVVQFDGSEFKNPQVRKLLQEHDIQTWISGTKRKAAVVERLNRTLKEKMMKYFTAKQTSVWYSVLPDIIQNYNSQKNRSIGMPPEDVNEENKHTAWMRLYGQAQGPIPKPKYKVGDLVRVLDYTRHQQDLEAWKILHPEKVQEEKESRRDPETGRIKPKPNIHLISSKNKPKFSDEVFTVSEVKLGYPVVYKLYSDQIHGEILGKFYERKLSHVLVA